MRSQSPEPPAGKSPDSDAVPRGRMVVRVSFRAYLDALEPLAAKVLVLMNEPTPKPELEVKSDADWKRQVKQEAADLDARRAQQQSQAAAESSPADSDASTASGATAETTRPGGPTGELPPADFTMLVTMFSTQAMVSLGVVPHPETGKPEQNLTLARHFIDLLGVLQEKTRRNLTGHESDLLQNSLHELRLAYIELSRSDSAGPAPDTERTDTST